MRLQQVVGGLALIALAALQRIVLAPDLTRIPADYAEETQYDAASRSREKAEDDWQYLTLTARRVDQTLVAARGHLIVQGDLHWADDSGIVLFESSGIYQVDRYSRTNLAGYGDIERGGQFLFPTHVQETTYRYWDPMYVGERTARFERHDWIADMDVLVFRFTAKDLDESAGYAHLPDVPERYEAHTNGEGVLRVEPMTGVVIDYEDTGTSYFFDPVVRTHVADMYIWTSRYTQQTREFKIAQAKQLRRRMIIVERVAPAALLIGGIAMMGFGLARRRGSGSVALTPAREAGA
ncbi:DUF3068 domain-containing protein [Tahibacter amnicola]|uniref:DUF3068 domain-containing protein n=1 Tax=Tahibacter amnicola TaxID=2976241 RepID=A0ABY6BKC2_9GAMM|nr:DUF3068 domain-containing protein [Tahibacter amnicola]UXI70461.1 DUF3068 domain-containing protein [Tahibacter amnicola]